MKTKISITYKISVSTRIPFSQFKCARSRSSRGQFCYRFEIRTQRSMVQGWLTTIERSLFLWTPLFSGTDSLEPHLNTSHLPGAELLVQMKAVYNHTIHTCLYNIVWRAVNRKVLGLSPRVTTSHPTCGNSLTLRSCQLPQVTLLEPPTVKRLNTPASLGRLPDLAITEVYQTPPTLVFGFQKVVPTSRLVKHSELFQRILLFQ